MPFVAGVMAQMLESAPDTAPAQLQQQLASGAVRGKLSEVPGSGFETFEQVSVRSNTAKAQKHPIISSIMRLLHEHRQNRLPPMDPPCRATQRMPWCRRRLEALLLPLLSAPKGFPLMQQAQGPSPLQWRSLRRRAALCSWT